MRLLLDANAFLFFIAGDAKLSAPARMAIEDTDNEKLISIATLWEIAIKSSLGKLSLAEPFDVLIPREMGQAGFILLPITFAHVSVVHNLPFHHRDPFDRLIIAQAMADSMPVVSSDVAFDAYSVERIW